MSSLIYPTPKLSPFQGLSGFGGGATGLGFAGGAVDKGGSVYYDADENLRITGANVMQVYDFDQNASFCVECWINMEQMSRWNYIALRWHGSSPWTRLWRFGVNDQNKLTFLGNVSVTQSSATMTTDTWYHVAAVREGTTQGYSNYMRLYVNGTEVGNNSGSGSSMTSTTTPVSIGANDESVSYSMRGYISNFRITVNEPVYTGSFTPSTTPLTVSSQVADSANVRLLCCQSATSPTEVVYKSQGTMAIANGAPTASDENPF